MPPSAEATLAVSVAPRFHHDPSTGPDEAEPARGPTRPTLTRGPAAPDPNSKTQRPPPNLSEDHRKCTHVPQICGPGPFPPAPPPPHLPLRLRLINSPCLASPLSPRKKPQQQEQFLRSLEKATGRLRAREKAARVSPLAPPGGRRRRADSTRRSAVREGIPLRFGLPPSPPLNPRATRVHSIW